MVEQDLTNQVENLYNATVYDQDGDKIGGVAQVYLDDQSGRPNWATVKTGFFGTKETFVPLDDADVSGDDIRVPYTKDFVKDAPNMDADVHIDEAQETELYRYYSKSHDQDRTGVAGGAAEDRRDRDFGDQGVAGPQRDVLEHDADRPRETVDVDRDRAESVVRHEEEVHVGTERVETGRLRLRKHVVTEQKTVTVPVSREEYTLEREPIADGERVGAAGEVGEEEIGVTVHEERPVVEKEVVAKERIGLGKETVTEDREVTTDVSKEEVTLEEDGVRGDTDRRVDKDGNPLT
ncbi:MAG: PRC and DUF2382 domain-containing protein [Micrococcales bacterium]|nr:PRC and DUF2382 domain-containing protein [Micrococcales bacterium]